jgi:hypothetical protein
MPRGRLSSAAALLFALTALIAASAAGGALVIVEGIVLHADGSFQPRALPRQRFAPIDFQGYFDIAASGGGKPVELKQALIDFDRDGRLSAGGLPVCPPERVAEAGPAQARRICAGAIVGTGRIEALVGPASSPVTASSALTIFNGPPQAGHPTVVLHARTTVPGTQTFAILVPIERRPGPFRYRATIDIPPIAGGLGAITRVEAKVGRRFSVDGQERSYVSAHCSDGILHTHGIFSFANGTIVDGSVEKFCRAR